ncbi:cytochrome c oxidase assembly factor Coa1 family protein [Hyalangium minutum]|uniref:Cytochrome oxidase complex assembly protein 1 n=1 Tax=Hyalangium minutum TaxID=394096 RepID=A0A085W5P7_9BACT|nr:cytochrome c oxidase assembly factor Coa1 family protein [Hyalangium minutum]KFE63010.1 hypothetical protein DB31_3069 [Hyalangium minutum]
METSPEGNMAPQRSWWSRNWKWAVPVGCLGLMASCCGFTLLAGALGWNFVTNNPASTRALEIARADSEVQAVLGTPIETHPLKQQSNVHYANGQSRAEATIELDGPKEDGVLRMEAVKSNDEWVYEVLEVEVPGQEPIDLMDKVGGVRKRELAPPTPDAPPPPHAPPPPPGAGPSDEDDADTQEDGDGKSDINL